jgi:hypothetical protein
MCTLFSSRSKLVLQVVVLDAEVRLFTILVFFSFGSNFSQAHNSKTKRFAQTQQYEHELTKSISSNLLYKYQAQVNGEQTRKFMKISERSKLILDKWCQLVMQLEQIVKLNKRLQIFQHRIFIHR